MPDANDLCRRLDAALATAHLHPQYARTLLRECWAALYPEPYAVQVVACEAVPPGEAWFVQDGQLVGRITGLGS